MHERCPQCGILFRREPGYFLGAMYYSYGMGVFSLAPLCVTLLLLGASIETIGIAVFVQSAIFSPFLFRYSRVMWMHMDQRFDPRDRFQE